MKIELKSQNFRDLKTMTADCFEVSLAFQVFLLLIAHFQFRELELYKEKT